MGPAAEGRHRFADGKMPMARLLAIPVRASPRKSRPGHIHGEAGLIKTERPAGEWPVCARMKWSVYSACLLRLGDVDDENIVGDPPIVQFNGTRLVADGLRADGPRCSNSMPKPVLCKTFAGRSRGGGARYPKSQSRSPLIRRINPELAPRNLGCIVLKTIDSGCS